MNIDFHYGVIYAVARLAGLEMKEATTVAHACQYVDDATTTGVLEFAGGETFERFASAHRMFDYKNMLDGQNRLVWVPFHFLPGAEGTTLDEKAICKPNSAVAKDMVKHTLAARRAENSLHRLGVMLHVYVDTWAHQGFSGISSLHNTVHTLVGDNYDHNTWLGEVKACLEEAGENVQSTGLDLISRLGHGAALHFPDMPWADWRYKNGHHNEIQRKNLPDFVDAADHAYKVVREFAHRTTGFESQPGLSPNARNSLEKILKENRDHDEQKRLIYFSEQIAKGALAGLKEEIPKYIAKGPNSWKHTATGLISVDDSGTKPKWTPAFEASDYRHFHDAVKEHRFIITQEILPEHGVRLA